MGECAAPPTGAGVTIRRPGVPAQVLKEVVMTSIIGIDFSGAKSDRSTWVAQGKLTVDGALLFYNAEMTPRKQVLNLLSTVSTPAVAGIDFPFGVPRAFANSLCGGSDIKSMPDVWYLLAGMTQHEFIATRDAFVERFGELKRAGDEYHFPESFSPLHKVNPNMLPMTFLGIRMLSELHSRSASRWVVPPLESQTADRDSTVTLLETMPGAFLKAIGFDYAVYKRYKKARNALQNRRFILDSLSIKSGIDLPNIADLREDCLANDDCLDSVIAAVTAACWAQNAARFRHPNRAELTAANLEGWIYVPKS